MWLTKKLNSHTENSVVTGKLTAAGNSSSGEAPTVQSSDECRTTETIFPYGYNSHAPQGEKTAMLGSFCLGINERISDELQPGEIMLQSKGGAKILLRNNGEVVINGERFIKRN